MAKIESVQVRNEDGYWSVFVNGQRMVDRESFAVADRVADCIRNPRAHVNTESREVADSIIRHVEGS